MEDSSFHFHAGISSTMGGFDLQGIYVREGSYHHCGIPKLGEVTHRLPERQPLLDIICKMSVFFIIVFHLLANDLGPLIL